MTASSPRSASSKLSPSVIPLHHQLYISLRQRILDGVFSPSVAMPGEIRLSEEFGVSRVTLRRTLETLESQGLIIRKRGVGTFAAPRPEQTNGSSAATYAQHLSAFSSRIRHELVEFEIAPTPHFLDNADAAYGPTVLRIIRVGFLGDQPAHSITGYTAGRLAHLIDKDVIANRPIAQLLQDSGVGIDRTQLRIGAVAADPIEAARLTVPIGSPLVRSDRASFVQGHAVNHVVVLSRPDLFTYSFVADESDGSLKPG